MYNDMIMALGLCLFVMFTAQCGEDDGEGVNRLPSADFKISGIAQGGEISLVFITGIRSNLTLIKITTVAGETAKQVGEKLYDAYIQADPQPFPPGGVVDNDVQIPHFMNGQIAFRSTDPGIFSIKNVADLQAQPQAPDKVALSWSVPAGTEYDKIVVYCNSRRFVAVLPGTATSVIDTIDKNHPLRSLRAGPQLKYWVVGIKNGTPSDVSQIEIANPNP